MIKYDKFTIKVQEALMAARSLAQTNDNQQIEPIHLLIALIEQKDGITTPLFQKLGVNNNQLLFNFSYTDSKDSEMTLNPPITGIKLLSPAHLGTT